MQTVYIHGLESSSRGTKGRFFRERFPRMVLGDYSGDLEWRLEQLEKDLAGRPDRPGGGGVKLWRPHGDHLCPAPPGAGPPPGAAGAGPEFSGAGTLRRPEGGGALPCGIFARHSSKR